jgi:endonuclease/exonuclease/phosphatase (EEP) superfamily protein YafD
VNKELLKRQNIFQFLHWLGLLCSAVSIILGVGILACYIARWDTVSAVTLLPFWAWGIAGIGLSLIGWRLQRRKWHLLIFLTWVCLTLFCSDDLSKLVQSSLPWPTFGTVPATGLHLRVVTLNCAGGQASAAAEVSSWKPDLVLLQETPDSNVVSRLAWEWFGSDGDFLVGGDCSIISRGQLARLSGLKTIQFTQAHWTLPQGKVVEVVNLRLLPPETRLDLWSPDCWRAHREDRVARKAQMQQLVDHLEGSKSNIPCIVGGDFNAPAGDAVSRLLKPHLKDAFREAGIGWGNTGINEFPASRPDQIWASGDFQTIAVRAVKTRNSDHRMVVCDLVLRP